MNFHFTYVTISTFKSLRHDCRRPLVSGQWERMRTTSPFWDFLLFFSHFWRVCKVCIYSTCHLCQNWSAKYWTCFQELLRESLVPNSGMSNCKVCAVFWCINMSGESTWGASGSVDIATSGLAFSIALTSIRNVVKTSCVRGPLWFMSKLSMIFIEAPIILSHTPPKWEAWGGLNTDVILFSSKYFCDNGSSINRSEGMFSSCTAPMKLVPRSDLNWMTCHLNAVNLRNALINEEVNNSSMASKWTARETRQVNIKAHLLWFTVPPLVRRCVVIHGPKVSIPT